MKGLTNQLTQQIKSEAGKIAGGAVKRTVKLGGDVAKGVLETAVGGGADPQNEQIGQQGQLGNDQRTGGGNLVQQQQQILTQKKKAAERRQFEKVKKELEEYIEQKKAEEERQKLAEKQQEQQEKQIQEEKAKKTEGDGFLERLRKQVSGEFGRQAKG